MTMGPTRARRRRWHGIAELPLYAACGRRVRDLARRLSRSRRRLARTPLGRRSRAPRMRPRKCRSRRAGRRAGRRARARWLARTPLGLAGAMCATSRAPRAGAGRRRPRAAWLGRRWGAARGRLLGSACALLGGCRRRSARLGRRPGEKPFVGHMATPAFEAAHRDMWAALEVLERQADESLADPPRGPGGEPALPRARAGRLPPRAGVDARPRAEQHHRREPPRAVLAARGLRRRRRAGRVLGASWWLALRRSMLVVTGGGRIGIQDADPSIP